MTRRELDAAGITDPALRAAYATCRELNARHGRTYFLATRLLPAERRPAVHALYGFARWADDLVDLPDPATGLAGSAAALDRLEQRLVAGLRGGDSDEPVVRALADTAGRYAIDHRHFTDFMASMRSDLTVTDYPTYDDLRGYMHGSAAVIGLQMVPVLGTVVPRAEAEPYAAALGLAFQLTNFIRDVREDLTRGRIYLPLADLRRFGIGEADLFAAGAAGVTPPEIRDLIRYETGRAQRHYALARPGIGMLARSSQACMRTAYLAYGAILDEVARSGYDVLAARAVVPTSRRLRLAATSLLGRGDLPVPGPVLPG